MTREELKKIRDDLGMTQKALSEALNTPFRTLQDWEYGKRRIPGILEIALACLKKKGGEVRKGRQPAVKKMSQDKKKKKTRR
jgi:DNA-binding transcriptional regulator YiaG